MDNNEVYALFEDIKGGLKSINDKLENTPKVDNKQSFGHPPAMDLVPLKEHDGYFCQRKPGTN